MNQIIFRLLLTTIIVVLLIQTGAINALFMLIVAGSLPGTDYIIPANIMMLGYCSLICVVLFYSTGKGILRAILNHHIQPSENTADHSPAKRRFKILA